MKTTLLLTVLAAFFISSEATTCRYQDRLNGMFSDWVTVAPGCEEKMKTQINTEVKASMTYLAMGAYFSRDRVNRPGFAKFFFDAASEERQHAKKLIEYLLMRGKLTTDIKKLITIEYPTQITWANGLTAMEDALKTEHKVTESIRDVIKECEDSTKFNHYHLVDYLTGEFLDEQYKGQKELADKIATLRKMMTAKGELGEFLFDKKLLGVEIMHK